MVYVQRNPEGTIVAVSATSAPGFEESVDERDPAVRGFLEELGSRGLADTDLGFIRVLEDLIELLIQRNVIRFTDLPAPAQQKMLERQELRDRLRPHLDLLDEERDELLL